MLLKRAIDPVAVLLTPVVLVHRALTPLAVLSLPVVLEYRVPAPSAVFLQAARSALLRGPLPGIRLPDHSAKLYEKAVQPKKTVCCPPEMDLLCGEPTDIPRCFTEINSAWSQIANNKRRTFSYRSTLRTRRDEYSQERSS